MPSLEDFSRIVGGIYAAALSPDDWVKPLADIRGTIDAVAAGLIAGDDHDRTIKSSSLPTEARDQYASHYRTVDYVLADVEQGPVGLARDGAELVALQPHSEFNIDWMKPHDLQDGIFVRLTGGSTPTCFLVAAPQRSNPYATGERLRFVNALVPHWQQALAAHDHLTGLDAAAADVVEVIDVLRHALVVLDGDGEIQHMNRSAMALLASSDGLRCRGRAVQAVRPATDTELQVNIGRAVGCGDRGYRRGAGMTCPRTSGGWPYIVHVLPLGCDAGPTTSGRALLIVIDPDDKPWPTTELVRRIFRMTRAEAEVAVRILDGDGLKPISEELSLSPATVKTHLQHVFDKTQTHRQAELVRLLLAVIP